MYTTSNSLEEGWDENVIFVLKFPSKQEVCSFFFLSPFYAAPRFLSALLR